MVHSVRLALAQAAATERALGMRPEPKKTFSVARLHNPKNCPWSSARGGRIQTGETRGGSPPDRPTLQYAPLG